MRIRCLGYVEGESFSTDKLIKWMRQVQDGNVKRPEIEIVEGEGQGEAILIHIAALFREGSGEFVGWLVSTKDTASGNIYAYCVSSGKPAIQHESVLFCGSPETINQSAILRVEQAADLVQQLIDGNCTRPFSCERLTEIIV